MEELAINEDALAPLLRLKKAGFILVATTNQPGVSAGTVLRRELDAIHQELTRVFQLDDILVCPHADEDACPCRKPSPGLLREAAFKWHLDLDRTYVISDKWQDAAAAHNAGCKSLLLASPWTGTGHHDIILPDLAAIANKIMVLSDPNGQTGPHAETRKRQNPKAGTWAKAATF
jgi:D-glycero-D-manno-heptose 1,7-bisphosphate phosphatase